MATEKRLIDVLAEIRKIQEVLAEHQAQADSLAYRVFESVKTALEQAPTVDAVEVVRCKDCKNCRKCVYPFSNKTFNECKVWRSMTRDDDFCSYGERREGE